MAVVRVLLMLLIITVPNVGVAIDRDSSAWIEKIGSDVARGGGAANQVWNDLVENGVISNGLLNGDNRGVFTLIQSKVEAGIAAALKHGDIKNALIVIHSPQPATPLRVVIGGGDWHRLAISPGSKKVLRWRRKILLSYLKQGGVLVSVYEKDYKYKKQVDIGGYLDLVRRSRSLLSRPIKEIPHDCWGATYLVRQLDDSVYAFSISADQASMNSDMKGGDREWSMWFGQLLNTEVSKRVVQIESFLKSEGVDIYSYIGFEHKK